MRYGATPRAQQPQLTQAHNLGCPFWPSHLYRTCLGLPGAHYGRPMYRAYSGQFPVVLVVGFCVVSLSWCLDQCAGSFLISPSHFSRDWFRLRARSLITAGRRYTPILHPLTVVVFRVNTHQQGHIHRVLHSQLHSSRGCGVVRRRRPPPWISAALPYRQWQLQRRPPEDVLTQR